MNLVINPVIKPVNIVLTTVETGFNFAGSLPFVASYSGPMRAAFGIKQMVAGLGLTFFAASAKRLDKTRERQWEHLSKACFENFIHGAMNCARGRYEEQMAITVIGSICLYLLQSEVREWGFAPLFPYGVMQLRPKTAAFLTLYSTKDLVRLLIKDTDRV